MSVVCDDMPCLVQLTKDTRLQHKLPCAVLDLFLSVKTQQARQGFMTRKRRRDNRSPPEERGRLAEEVGRSVTNNLVDRGHSFFELL